MGFFLGMMVGGFIGFMACALMIVASESDDRHGE